MNRQNSDEQINRLKQRVEKKSRKGKLALKIVLIILSILLGMLLVIGITIFVLFKVGENKMTNYEDVVVVFPEPAKAEEQEKPEAMQDGKEISYNGHTYRLNENISTVLFIGVDKEELEEAEHRGDGGEADCIMLVAVDTESGKTKVINISRESYAQVDIYSSGGKYVESRNTQLCRAFAYGDGQVLSCENTLKSVSRLLYGLPIHSYIAVDMSVIGAAADSLGGVKLTSLDDVIMFDKSVLHEGEETTLFGRYAEYYVRYRDKKRLDGNIDRMERQKQFVDVFVKQVLQTAKGDIPKILDLYQTMMDYTQTDLSLADVTFLVSTFIGNGASISFDTLPGTLQASGKNAIYYLDETALYETVLDVYYTRVD